MTGSLIFDFRFQIRYCNIIINRLLLRVCCRSHAVWLRGGFFRGSVWSIRLRRSSDLSFVLVLQLAE